MGGGKSVTFKDLVASTLFNATDDLYVKDMVRLFALSKKVDPVFFTNSMIRFSRNYFSPETFEAMGVGVRNTAEVKAVTYERILEYFEAEFPHILYAVYYVGYTDAAGNLVNPRAHKINLSLSNKYPTNAVDFSKDFTYQYTFNVSTYQTTCDRVTIDEVYEELNGHPGPDIYDFVETTPAYEVESGKWYSLKDDTISETNQVTLLELDASWVETGVERLVSVTEDNRVAYLYKFGYSNNLCGEDGDPDYGDPGDPLPVWSGEEAGLFFNEDIVPDVSHHVFMIFPIKAGRQFVERPHYQEALMQGFGLGNGVLKESLADEEIKAAMLTYSTYLEDPAFQEVIESIYGTENNRNNVVLQSGYYNIEYDMHGSCETWEYECAEPEYKISFNYEYSTTISNQLDKNLVMIPVTYYRDLGMRARYDALRDTFRLWANSKVTVEKKWYQTGFFKFALLVVALVASVYTGNPYAAIAVVGMHVASQYLSPEIMAVIALVGVAFGIYTFETSGKLLLDITTYFAMAATALNSVIGLVIGIESKDIQEDIDDVKDDTAELNKQLAEERNKTGFYSPFDSYDGSYGISVGAGAYDFSAFYDNAHSYESRSFKQGIYLS